jgi:hypothetical protein
MYDLTITLGPGIGALAEAAETLGRAGISIEGGGAWGDPLVAHFLVEEGESARSALAATGILAPVVKPVLIQGLDQERPGQLGLFTRRLADAGVRVEVLYSDHANRLIVVVDDPVRGAAISAAWESQRSA